MGKVVLDKTGSMRDGCFFRLSFLSDEDLLQVIYGDLIKAPGVHVSRRVPSEIDLITAGKSGHSGVSLEWFPEAITDVVRGCPVDRAHVLQKHEIRPKVRPTNVGPVPDITVASLESNHVIVCSVPFASKLRASPLTGFRFEQVVMLESGKTLSETPDPNPPFRVLALEARGRRCLRPLKVVDGQNSCPHCGQHVIVCAECGEFFPICPVCDEITAMPAKGHPPGDKSFVDTTALESPIVELTLWDGSDVCYYDAYTARIIVTKRVVTWLQSVHANAVWVATPLKCCVDNGSSEQLKKLEKAIVDIGA
jgi:hypothetical protein